MRKVNVNIDNVDIELLKVQTEDVIEYIVNSNINSTFSESLIGILNLLEHIQDKVNNGDFQIAKF